MSKEKKKRVEHVCPPVETSLPTPRKIKVKTIEEPEIVDEEEMKRNKDIIDNKIIWKCLTVKIKKFNITTKIFQYGFLYFTLNFQKNYRRGIRNDKQYPNHTMFHKAYKYMNTSTM